jgi:hypothetical protein
LDPEILLYLHVEVRTEKATHHTTRRAMHPHIIPGVHVALRLPSGLLKILEITPNTYVA